LEERTESNRDRVGVGDRSYVLSERVVRAAVCDFSKPHDGIFHPKRRRHRNFGRRY